MSLFSKKSQPDIVKDEINQQEIAIRKALESMHNTSVREVMTPRADVVALRDPVSVDDITDAVRKSGHSRFPVYAEDLDELVGVLFVKDLFRAGTWGEQTKPEEITRKLRKPLLVPESRPVLALLQEMRLGRRAFAVVVDEHGGVEGIITIKDLISKLVGDLPDEYDTDQDADIQRVDASRWLVDGASGLDDVRVLTSMPIPDGEYVTFGGFILWLAGNIPQEGDSLEFKGWELKVESMDRRRVSTVIVKSPEEPKDTSDADPDINEQSIADSAEI